MKIRKAHAGESPALVVVEMDAGHLFKTADPEIMGNAGVLGLPPEIYAPYIARGDIFVAVDEADRAVGFAAMGWMDSEAYLAELSVMRAHQRKGVGAALVAACEEWALVQGQHSIILHTYRRLAWNGPYYEKLGFKFLAPETCQGPDAQKQRQNEAKHGVRLHERVFMRKTLERE